MSGDGHVIDAPHRRIELPAATPSSLGAPAAELVPDANPHASIEELAG